jgi:hypothetical protein
MPNELIVVIAGLMTLMGELVLHWFPWRMALGRELKRTSAYILGTLAMLGPYSLALVWWTQINAPMYWALIGLLCCVTLAGIAVLGAYLVDEILLNRRKVQENDEREGMWADAVTEASHGATRRN